MEIPYLEMTGIRHAYGPVKAVDVPEFSIQKGECLVILGPNGSGKSTLLRLASLLEKPSEGKIRFQGEDVTDGARIEVKRRFVLLLQRPFLFRGSVEKNLLFGLKIRKIPLPERKKRLERVAALFSLEHLLHRDARKLSGGETQRVNLARAFILEPDILFLDEPFSALDAPTREEIILELKRVISQTGQTTVFVTHHREEAAFLADRMVIMIEGCIPQTGATEAVFSSPANDEVARLVGHAVLLKGTVLERNGNTIVVSHGSQRILAGGDAPEKSEVMLFLRPEDVLLARAKFDSSVRNWFEGRVIRMIPSDRFVLVHLDCGFILKALLTRAAIDELGLKKEDRVWAGVKASSLHALSADSISTKLPAEER
jgi:tungstate transport system ATP-binding protein